jgi:hypothetical protein
MGSNSSTLYHQDQNKSIENRNNSNFSNRTRTSPRNVPLKGSETGNPSNNHPFSVSPLKNSQDVQLNFDRKIVTMPCEHPYLLSTTCSTIRGRSSRLPNKPNQDNFIMETDPLTGAVLLGVLDGHGEMGHIISLYLGNYLRQFIFRHPLFPSKIETAVKECILDAEREIKNNGLVSINFNGTTLCLAVFYNNKVVFANLGDSRAISLGINNKNALYSRQITVDHKPELKNEKMRIEGTGGKVAPIQNKNGPQGPSRVWLPELNVPGLAMSR